MGEAGRRAREVGGLTGCKNISWHQTVEPRAGRARLLERLEVHCLVWVCRQQWAQEAWTGQLWRMGGSGQNDA